MNNTLTVNLKKKTWSWSSVIERCAPNWHTHSPSDFFALLHTLFTAGTNTILHPGKVK